MYRPVIHSLIAFLLCLQLISCGGGSSGGIGGTGITTNGTITGFGSIFVNGIKFDTDNVQSVTGDLNLVDDLRLGMVVTVRGTVNNDGITGTADSIDVDIELEGPITNLQPADLDTNTRSFSVLGRTIIASEGSTVFDGTNFTFTSMAENDLVEVSGFMDANGAVQATRIEKEGIVDPGNSAVEIEGVVGTVNSASFTLMVNGTPLTINNPNGLTVDGDAVMPGQTLEVKGIFISATVITATEIELEEGTFNDDDMDIEIEGIITNYISPADFRIDGVRIDASAATLIPSNLQLGDNIKVKVEGDFANGILTAESVEQRDADICIQANISMVDTANNKIQLGFGSANLTVMINNQTKLDDDLGSSLLTLQDLSPGDFVQIKAYQDNTDIIATDLKREEDEMDGEIELRGPVSTVTPQDTITILGITYIADGNTEFEISGITSTRADFFSNVGIGEVVEITDNKVAGTADGIADEMDLKD